MHGPSSTGTGPRTEIYDCRRHSLRLCAVCGNAWADILCSNEEVKASMRMAKPAGTGVSVISAETAIANFKAGKYDGQRVFVLVKEPETLIRLIEGGVEIPKVDLGIMFNEDGRTPISKFIALNEKEKEDLETIKGKGIPVVIQYVPTDAEEAY